MELNNVLHMVASGALVVYGIGILIRSGREPFYKKILVIGLLVILGMIINSPW